MVVAVVLPSHWSEPVAEAAVPAVGAVVRPVGSSSPRTLPVKDRKVNGPALTWQVKPG